MYNIDRSLEALQPESFAYAGELFGETSFLTEGESPFSEAEEMELAYELLEVTNEAELEQFLGNLFKKAWGGIKSFSSKIINPLGGVLKTVAKTALPFLATAAGTFLGGPAGGAIAGKLGSLVSQALEVETSSTFDEDRDFEKCLQFVRMAGNAAKAAALAPRGTEPVSVAKKVLTDSALEKIAKANAALKTQGLSRQPAVSSEIKFGGETRQASPITRPQTIGRNTPPFGSAEIIGKSADSAIASTRNNPLTSLGKTAINPSALKLSPNINTQPVKTCGCKNSANCTCGKCNKAGHEGRWVRRGSSIVIINC